MYSILRNLLFNFDAEAIHHFSMKVLEAASKMQPSKKYLTTNLNLTIPIIQTGFWFAF